ncbi:MAG TPA: YdcF family protein [Leptolyngbyaceae cyanobacterium M65_K2018_010]|nr:YdcF family protein [Leptolyngbyaceae cyanobacterium M65_K2018_010]
MFLFLSKLLPLLFYPLGLVSLLMVLALVLLGQRPRWAALALGLALVILVLSSNAWVSSQVVQSLEGRYLPPPDLPTAEAIVVLGGGIKPESPPRPWLDVAEEGDRVLHGAQLYLAGKAPLIIFSGGRITWGQAPTTRSEAADMADLALALGVPATAMVQEPDSLNTYQNALYVKGILEQRGIKRVLLVTSAMHMPRSLAIFKKQGIEAIPAPTDFHIAAETLALAQTTWQGRWLSWVPQTENLHYLTRALKEYVGIVIYRLKGWL